MTRGGVVIWFPSVETEGRAEAEIERLDELDLTDERQAEWYSGTPLPAPPRTHTPPLPTIGVRLFPPDPGSEVWGRVRITSTELDQAQRSGVPVCRCWAEVDLASGLYHRQGVIVLDPVAA